MYFLTTVYTLILQTTGLPEPSMAIARDSSSISTFSSASSQTWSHTIAGSDRLLIVFGYAEANRTQTCTYNGSAMTQFALATYTVGDVRRGYGWYMIAPPVGTANIVITNSGAGYMGGVGISFTGADQTTQPDASNTNTNTSGSTTSISTTVTTVNNNAWITGMVEGTATSPSGTGAFNATALQSGGVVALYDTNGPITPAGATSVGGSWTGGNSALIVAGSIKPAAAGPTGVKTWDGITQSTGIKTYFGVAVASVKSVNGVT